MKRTKSFRRPQGHIPPRPGGPKAVIRLDTHTIRQKALNNYKRAEREMDKLRSLLKRFHDQDVPGFRTWLHHNFGALLTRQRELAQAFNEKRALLEEIRHYCFVYGLSEVEAYRKVMWRHAHPEEAEQEDRKEEEEARKHLGDDGESEDDEDFDESEIFDEEDFSSIPDNEWEDFCDYYESMSGIRPPPRNRKPVNQDHPDSKSAKELYRTIVRQLHPDHHGHMTEARKNLWHEAQAAYQRNDVAALYNILARCDNGEAGIGGHSPVSLILRLTLQLKQTCRATRSDISRMKRDVAWDYENRSRNPRFVRDVRHDIEQGLKATESDLRQAEELLRELELLASRPQPPPRKKQGRRRPPLHPDFMDELPF